jgi:hypothetical protein
MPVRMIRQQCRLDSSGERRLEMTMRRMGFSARAHDRILKVARPIADLDESNRFRQNTWRKPCNTEVWIGITGGKRLVVRLSTSCVHRSC